MTRWLWLHSSPLTTPDSGLLETAFLLHQTLVHENGLRIGICFHFARWGFKTKIITSPKPPPTIHYEQPQPLLELPTLTSHTFKHRWSLYPQKVVVYAC